MNFKTDAELAELNKLMKMHYERSIKIEEFLTWMNQTYGELDENGKRTIIRDEKIKSIFSSLCDLEAEEGGKGLSKIGEAAIFAGVYTMYKV